eukprot:scaffold43311_cov129-Isochrysis_galbana.AAC.1
MQLGTAVVLRLAWRARGGGCGASKVAAERGPGGAGVEGPPPHRPAVRKVKVGKEQMGKWKEDGGPELEAVVASDAVALLSARWVVALAKREGG